MGGLEAQDGEAEAVQRCKSERSSCAKVRLTRCVRGAGTGIGAGVGKYFQVSGLGRREPDSGVQVRVQVRDLNFTPTRTCT